MLGLGGCCGNTLQNIFREVKLKSLSMRQYSHLFMREFWIGLIEVGYLTLSVQVALMHGLGPGLNKKEIASLAHTFICLLPD